MNTIKVELKNQSVKRFLGFSKKEIQQKQEIVLNEKQMYELVCFYGIDKKAMDGRKLFLLNISEITPKEVIITFYSNIGEIEQPAEQQKPEEQKQEEPKLKQDIKELNEKLQQKTDSYNYEYHARITLEDEEFSFFITPRNEPFNVLFKTQNIDDLPTLKVIYDLHKKATIKELKSFIQTHDDFKNCYFMKPFGNEKDIENLFHKRINETEYYFFQSVSYSRKHVYYKQQIKVNRKIGTIKDVKKLIDLLSK